MRSNLKLVLAMCVGFAAGYFAHERDLFSLVRSSISREAFEPVSLTSLKPSEKLVSWGDLKVNFYDNNLEIVVDGQRCDDFLFAHAPSRVVYQLPIGATKFTAVGIRPDDKSDNIKGDWNYVVKIDGKEVFRSARLADTSNKEVAINVEVPSGAEKLELINEDLGSNYADHSIWAYPKLR